MSSFSWGILGPGGIAQAFAKDLIFLEDLLEETRDFLPLLLLAL